MRKTIVSFVRQNTVNDIFKIVTLDTTTHEVDIEYDVYPRSMNMTENDIYNQLEA